MIFSLIHKHCRCLLSGTRGFPRRTPTRRPIVTECRRRPFPHLPGPCDPNSASNGSINTRLPCLQDSATAAVPAPNTWCAPRAGPPGCPRRVLDWHRGHDCVDFKQACSPDGRAFARHLPGPQRIGRWIGDWQKLLSPGFPLPEPPMGVCALTNGIPKHSIKL
jgi:hypothetical protein